MSDEKAKKFVTFMTPQLTDKKRSDKEKKSIEVVVKSQMSPDTVKQIIECRNRGMTKTGTAHLLGKKYEGVKRVWLQLDQYEGLELLDTIIDRAIEGDWDLLRRKAIETIVRKVVDDKDDAVSRWVIQRTDKIKPDKPSDNSTEAGEVFGQSQDA